MCHLRGTQPFEDNKPQRRSFTHSRSYGQQPYEDKTAPLSDAKSSVNTNDTERTLDGKRQPVLPGYPAVDTTGAAWEWRLHTEKSTTHEQIDIQPSSLRSHCGARVMRNHNHKRENPKPTVPALPLSRRNITPDVHHMSR